MNVARGKWLLWARPRRKGCGLDVGVGVGDDVMGSSAFDITRFVIQLSSFRYSLWFKC